MKYVLTVLWIFFLSSCTSDRGDAYYEIELKEEPVKISSIKNITGFFGQRMEVNRNNYIKSFPIDSYVDFIVNRQHTEWNWTQATYKGEEIDVILTPFANIGHWYRTNYPKPEKHSPAFSYAIWLNNN